MQYGIQNAKLNVVSYQINVQRLHGMPVKLLLYTGIINKVHSALYGSNYISILQPQQFYNDAFLRREN